MEWYYVDGGQRAGPVGEPEFDQLVASGKVQANTLVWREGMPNWQPLAEVRSVPVPAASLSASPAPAQTSSVATPAPGVEEVVCMHCQGIFPKENTIQYGTGYVCAACKPAFLQKLKEGATPVVGMNYAGFWIRVGAKLIDGLILAVVLVPFIIYMVFAAIKAGPTQQPTFAQVGGQILMNLLMTVVSIGYGTFFHGRYGATLGKMACGLKVVSAEGGKISYLRALGRAASELLSQMICYIGYILVAFDAQKRALHDHIASTRVIRIR